MKLNHQTINKLSKLIFLIAVPCGITGNAFATTTSCPTLQSLINASNSTLKAPPAGWWYYGPNTTGAKLPIDKTWGWKCTEIDSIQEAHLISCDYGKNNEPVDDIVIETNSRTAAYTPSSPTPWHIYKAAKFASCSPASTSGWSIGDPSSCLWQE